jgi:hypothetical protein
MNDWMDRTGARWRLIGAAAVLKLRSLYAKTTENFMSSKNNKLTFKLEPFMPEKRAEVGAADRSRAGLAPSARGESKHAENR